jgi:hypothetical protein
MGARCATEKRESEVSEGVIHGQKPGYTEMAASVVSFSVRLEPPSCRLAQVEGATLIFDGLCVRLCVGEHGLWPVKNPPVGAPVVGSLPSCWPRRRVRVTTVETPQSVRTFSEEGEGVVGAAHLRNEPEGLARWAGLGGGHDVELLPFVRLDGVQHRGVWARVLLGVRCGGHRVSGGGW